MSKEHLAEDGFVGVTGACFRALPQSLWSQNQYLYYRNRSPFGSDFPLGRGQYANSLYLRRNLRFCMRIRPSRDRPKRTILERQRTQNRSQGGTYRLQVDRNLYGAINGGGPDLTLTTFNGSIYIRRGQ